MNVQVVSAFEVDHVCVLPVKYICMCQSTSIIRDGMYFRARLLNSEGHILRDVAQRSALALGLELTIDVSPKSELQVSQHLY